MIRSKKSLRAFAALAGVAALTLSACGSSNDDNKGTTGDNGGSKSALCGKNLAFLGALTGDAGALGQNMVNGINLALKEYNDKNADCKISLKTFDSQGSPDKAPALATQIINDDSIWGLIGPGFSGESLATGKTFFEAGLPSISPSATNVTITQQGWTTWHRVIGNDDAQGAADAKYLTETAGAKKVYVIDDGQDYSKGLAGKVKS
jgi:branched-chain amino acid transport system substrate-binding protein